MKVRCAPLTADQRACTGNLDTQKEAFSIALCVRAVANAHKAAFENTLVVLFGEANMPHIVNILNGVARELSFGCQMRVTVFSDERKSDNAPIVGFITHNRSKENCVNTMRDFLSLDRLALAKPFVGAETDVPHLKRQLLNFEYEPIIDKKTEEVTGFTYSGKRTGNDDRCLALQFLLHLSQRYVRRQVRERLAAADPSGRSVLGKRKGA